MESKTTMDALMQNYEQMQKDKVTVIHSAFDEKPHTVAFVYVDKELSNEEKLEKAFTSTNTIQQAWWKNKNVEYIGPNESCRSTSIGDQVLIGDTKYVCEPVGWKKL